MIPDQFVFLALILSAVVNVFGIIPYLLDIVKGKTKPRIVSWFNWTLLTGIATAAAIADEQYASAVLTGASTTTTALVVLLSIKYGDRQFDRTDIICQVGAIIGLLLWVAFDDPLLALITTLAIDFVAGVPTFKHVWQKPYEETAFAFGAATVSAFLVLLTVQHITLAGLLYPVYILVVNAAIVLVLVWGPNVRRGGRV